MARLVVQGEPGLDMPLRVLDLALKLGLTPDRVLIEARGGACHIEIALPDVPGRTVSLLVERLRSMILVGRADLEMEELQPRKLSILRR